MHNSKMTGEITTRDRNQQARLLRTGEDTRFPVEMLRTQSYLYQTHCERMADFLLEGRNIWWSMDGDNIVNMKHN